MTSNQLNMDVYKEFMQTLIPSNEALLTLYKTFEEDCIKGIENGPTYNVSGRKSGIACINTDANYFQCLQTIKDTFVINIEMFGINAAYVSNVDMLNLLDPKNMKTAFVPYTTSKGDETQLGNSNLTATLFVESVVKAVRMLLQQIHLEVPTEAVLTSCLFLDKQDSRTQFLLYSEFCDQDSLDPLADVDIVFLCNLHFKREKFPVVVKKTISHTTAHLFMGMQLNGKAIQKCLLSLHLGHTIRYSFYQPNAFELGYSGDILDVDVATYNKTCNNNVTSVLSFSLPYTVVDFEIGASKVSKMFSRPFEAMTATSYLHEICRRCVLRVFQTAAPSSFWFSSSLSYEVCAEIFGSGNAVEIIQKEFQELYGWELNAEEANLVYEIVKGVFNRSAALVAICIGALAKRTGRLQPALGGVSVGLTGKLGSHSAYQSLLRSHLNTIFSRDTEKLIVFLPNTDSSSMGAAIYNSCDLVN